MKYSIIRARINDLGAWVQMRSVLWPNHQVDELIKEAISFLEAPFKTTVFLFLKNNTKIIGFLEGNIRDYTEECHSNRVGYVEDWYVHIIERKKGIGELLMQAFFSWCTEQSITEVASDTWLWNKGSIKAHIALGFIETQKIVHFRKNLLQ